SACRTCPDELIQKTRLGNRARIFDGDVTDRVRGDCATRTFTCRGVNANIEVCEFVISQVNFRGGVIPAVNSVSTFVVTCNAAGTAWINIGMEVTRINRDGGVIGDLFDGVPDGVANFGVMCNAAGTAWERDGIVITRVECTVLYLSSACRMCAMDLITIAVVNRNAHFIDDDDIDRVTGACARRVFTCRGLNANIEIQPNGGDIPDDFEGAPRDGVATFDVTCNAAGNAWIARGLTITRLECT
ncbi:hypothetical protein PFISCL1PPCAC_8850, partial [Pristionchus fissidentatus]